MSEQQPTSTAQVEPQAKEESSLLDDIMAESNISSSDESYSIAKEGVSQFISLMIKGNKKDKVRKQAVDEMIAEIDTQISGQLDQILHNEKFQQMESSWRGLKFLVDNVDFRTGNRVEMINISKEDLYDDFEDASDIVESGLYKHVYSDEYGQFGGEPFSAIIANYNFDHGSYDINLLRNSAAVAAMSHAPFIAAASEKFFGVNDITDLANIKDLEATFEGPQYAKWRGFRDTENARYVGLTMPKFMLRIPYDSKENPVKAFNYNENIDGKHENYSWGNTAFAFATRLADSFSKYSWCPNIIGPNSGGEMENLPLHQYEVMGQIETKIPTEVIISDRREYELAGQGFIPLTFRKGSDMAAFFSANSTQKPATYGISQEDKALEMNAALGAQLPYMFIINRIAHYIKAIQRDNLGSIKSKDDLEQELNGWVRQFIADQDGVDAQLMTLRPLRQASITVSDVEGQPGIFKIELLVKPHFKYMGADFTLSLTGKLDKQ